MSVVAPVRYYEFPRARTADYYYVIKAYGPGSELLNGNIGTIDMYGTGTVPRRAKFFASRGFTFFRSDIKRDAREFERQHPGVRVVILCLPGPVKHGTLIYHQMMMKVLKARCGLLMKLMLKWGVSVEVATCIVSFWRFATTHDFCGAYAKESWAKIFSLAHDSINVEVGAVFL